MASTTYRKVSHREHVLLRPAAYIGSVDNDTCAAWLPENGVMKFRNDVSYTPGMWKIFDEIITNAIDHSVRTRQLKVTDDNVQLVKKIDVTVDKITGVLSVANDGDSIPVLMQDGMYVPEMIFGHLLTSSNYDDEADGDTRTIGGQNGIGAKACNILSEWFEIEIVDSVNHKKYVQKWSDNMENKSNPKITSSAAKKSSVLVRFLPQYSRFNLPNGLTDDMYQLLIKRVYDAAAVTDSSVNVTLNGNKIETKTFERYSDLYLGPKTTGKGRVYERPCDGWEVVASLSDGKGLQQISFVNGVATLRGGKHVDHIVNQISKKLCESIAIKSKKSTNGSMPKPQFVKDNLIVFVKSTIPSPVFDSLAKDALTTPVSKFGTKVEISDMFIDKMYKLEGLVERVIGLSGIAAEKEMKKSDGSKRSTINVPKLDDAEWAGTTRSQQCTLILTEGDSAKASAIAGLTVVGRQKYGVFPLRGKVMNVCSLSSDKIAANEEISALKKILGLQTGKVYTSTADLRYGCVMLMTDADHDGSHIRGLVMNLFYKQWPSLFKLPGFICSLLTPIVKVIPPNKRGTPVEFYNLHDFEQWKINTDNSDKWHAKYYKGLGTSTSEEARDWFRNMRKVVYNWNNEESAAAMDKAFDKKKADERKTWLQNYDPSSIISYGTSSVGFDDFVNKDLIHFSNYDVLRSIPSMVDGFKVSQRKALFGCRKRKLYSGEARVAQLAAYVSEHSCFHHGEASMQGTIIGMAQSFVGSGNNIPLLEEIGQFGTRLNGGADWASPRYIHTCLRKESSLIFPEADDAILKYLDDDGTKIEPNHYIPIIPLVLVNGATGIGTGYSTSVPSYNPVEVINLVRNKLNGDTSSVLGAPWYAGFKGVIENTRSRGIVKQDGFKIIVTELPLGYWTENFKSTLTTVMDAHPKDFKTFSNESSDTEVRFIITMQNSVVAKQWMSPANPSDPNVTKFEQELKMVQNRGLTTTNMHLYNSDGQIQKYETPNDIIDEFMTVRMDAYERRRAHIINALEYDLEVLANKVKFIELVLDKTLDLYIGEHKENDDVDEPDDDIADELEKRMLELGLKKLPTFSYLLSMPMSSLTRRRKITLDKQHSDKADALKQAQDTTAVTTWLKELDDLETYISASSAKKFKV